MDEEVILATIRDHATVIEIRRMTPLHRRVEEEGILEVAVTIPVVVAAAAAVGAEIEIEATTITIEAEEEILEAAVAMADAEMTLLHQRAIHETIIANQTEANEATLDSTDPVTNLCPRSMKTKPTESEAVVVVVVVVVIPGLREVGVVIREEETHRILGKMPSLKAAQVMSMVCCLSGICPMSTI